MAEDDLEQIIPLARYAAEYWIFNAQFKGISTHLWKGMEDLFDPYKPHFLAWLQVPALLANHIQPFGRMIVVSIGHARAHHSATVASSSSS
jgi:hypothetical protein